MKKVIVLLFVMGFTLGIFSLLTAQDNVAQLKEKIIDLQNQGELGFRHFTLCTNIIGFGQYVGAPSNQVKAGSEIFFYYEPVNVFTNRKDGIYHVWYTQDMIVHTADGEELYSGKEILNFNYQTTSPVLDLYATNSLELGDLPPGNYQFKVVIHDKLKAKDKSYTYTFKIVQ